MEENGDGGGGPDGAQPPPPPPAPAAEDPDVSDVSWGPAGPAASHLLLSAEAAAAMGEEMGRRVAAAHRPRLNLRSELGPMPPLTRRSDAAIAKLDSYVRRVRRLADGLEPSQGTGLLASGRRLLALCIQAQDDPESQRVLERWESAKTVASLDELVSRYTAHCAGDAHRAARALYVATLAGLSPTRNDCSMHSVVARLTDMLGRLARASPPLWTTLRSDPDRLVEGLFAVCPASTAAWMRAAVSRRSGATFHLWAVAAHLVASVDGGELLAPFEPSLRAPSAPDADDCARAFRHLVKDAESVRAAAAASAATSGSARTGGAHGAAGGRAKASRSSGSTGAAAPIATNATLAGALAPTPHAAPPATGTFAPGRGGAGGAPGGGGGREPSRALSDAEVDLCVYCGVHGHRAVRCPGAAAGRPPAADAEPLLRVRNVTRTHGLIARLAERAARGGRPAAGRAGGRGQDLRPPAAAADEVAPLRAPARPPRRFDGSNFVPTMAIRTAVPSTTATSAASGALLHGVPCSLAAIDTDSAQTTAIPLLAVVDTGCSGGLLVNEHVARECGVPLVAREGGTVDVVGVSGDRTPVSLTMTVRFQAGDCDRVVVALVVPDLPYPALLGMGLIPHVGRWLDLRLLRFVSESASGDGALAAGVDLVPVAAGGFGVPTPSPPRSDAEGPTATAPAPENGAGRAASVHACRAAVQPTHSPPPAAPSVPRRKPAGTHKPPAPAAAPQQRRPFEDVLAEVVAETPLTAAQIARFRKIYRMADPCFDGNQRGLQHVEPAVFELVPDASPRHERPYALSPAESEAVRYHVRRLVDSGKAEQCSSRWGAPCFVVRKTPEPQGPEDWRLVVNFAATVNGSTRSDPYPTPSARATLQRLAGHKLYSVQDFRLAYDQIWLAEQCRDCTAFVCELGQFRSTVLALGLANAPAIWSRVASKVLGEEIPLMVGAAASFFDDLCAADNGVDEHLDKMEALVRRLVYFNCQLSAKKERWMRRWCKLVGRVLSEAGISPEPQMLSALLAAPLPTTVKELLSFVGLAAYFYEFAPGAAHLCQTVRSAIAADAKGRRRVRWNEAARAAFVGLQERLASPDALAPPVAGERFLVYADASKEGLGAVLVQHGAVVSYASVALASDVAYARLDIRELEAAAALWALRAFELTIRGSPVSLLCDSKNLLHAAVHAPGGDPRYRRWLAAVAEYAPTFEYVPSDENLADLLSRVAPALAEGSSHPAVRLPVEMLSTRPAQQADMRDTEPLAASETLVTSEQTVEALRPPPAGDTKAERPASPEPLPLQALPAVAVNAARLTDGAGGPSAAAPLPKPPPAVLATLRAWLDAADTHVARAREVARLDIEQRPAGAHVPADRDAAPEPEQDVAELRDALIADDFCLALLLSLDAVDEPHNRRLSSQQHELESVRQRIEWLRLDRRLECFAVHPRRGVLVVSDPDSVGHADRQVVPAALVPLSLGLLHGVGHLGVGKMTVRAAPLYWPAMATDMDAFVASCPACVLTRSGSRARAGLLSASALNPSRPHSPWHSAHVDSVSLGHSAEGYTAACVATCASTGAVEVCAIRTTSAAAVVPWLLAEVVDRHHVRHLASDGGPEFLNALLASAVRARPGLTHVRSAPGHAEGNGAAENRVKWLRAAVAALQSHRPRASWPRALATLRNEHNSAGTFSTVFAPFTLITGRPCRPVTLGAGAARAAAADDADDGDDGNDEEATAYIRKWAQRWTADFRRRSAARRTAHANLSRYHVNFSTGDIVIKYVGPRTAKLKHRWAGPYRIVAVLRDGTYELARVARTRQPLRSRSAHLVAHVSYLRRYDSSPRTVKLLRDPDALARADAALAAANPGALPEPAGAESHEAAARDAADNGQLEGDISEIINFSVQPSGEVLFRVRWEGFGAASDTYEPYENIFDTEVFKQFVEQQLASPDARVPPARRGRRRRRR